TASSQKEKCHVQAVELDWNHCSKSAAFAVVSEVSTIHSENRLGHGKRHVAGVVAPVQGRCRAAFGRKDQGRNLCRKCAWPQSTRGRRRRSGYDRSRRSEYRFLGEFGAALYRV